MSEEKKEEKEQKPENEIRDLPVEKDVKGGDGNASRGTDPVHQPPIGNPRSTQ